MKSPENSTGSRLTQRAYWALLLLLTLGAAFRFFGINWDQSAGQHPDERHVLMCTWRLEWPKSVGEYFDEATSPLNPRNKEAHFFAYGTLPSTLLRGVVEVGGLQRPEQMTIAGRAMSAVADTLVIALVFALGWTLYRRVSLALLAAFFYAFAVLAIQHAHFFVVDPFANLFVAFALLFLARGWRSGKLYNYAATGVAMGLAISCKISVATFGLPVALVALLPLGDELLRSQERRDRASVLKRAIVRTLVFSFTTIVVVRCALPDAFSGFWPWQLAPRWLANMREVIDISTGVTDIPFTRQFYGRIPLLWPGWNLVVWGLGLALGIAAWTGWLAAAVQVLRKRIWAHALPVLWVGVVFFHLGFTYQPTLRYFLPIYGCLCVLAAWLLVTWTTRERRADGSRNRLAIARVSMVATMAFSVAWAVAFVSIYTRPHTRVEASEWIYKNVPNGSVLACEHWDDWLPLPLLGDRSPQQYQQIELPHYVADNGEKRGELLAKLNNADYIIIASQKLRDSIPRMPHRYPFTISYYQGLEDGSLGFDRVAEFTRSMNFLGWKISTRSAEEAFSVYDHPPVVIYKKAARYDPEALVQRFNAIPLDGVTDTRAPVLPQPAQANPSARERARAVEREGRPESAILLSKERWADAQKEGTWSAMFSRTSFAARHPVAVWVFQLLLLQLAGWALLGPLLRALPDRGAALARPFALLIPCWILWLAAGTGIAQSTRVNYWLILGAFTAAGVWVSWLKRADWRTWWSDKAGCGAAVRVELVFWSAFAAFVVIRSLNPDLWHPFWGGEKPMEMTFLNGVLRSSEFPPINPWYAGGFINYYYFGFVLCAGLIKGLGVLPEVGFNLCLATFFGMACAATFSVARALRPTGNYLVAWSATALVMVLGNLFQIRFIWNNLLRLGADSHTLTFPIISDVIRACHGLGKVMDGQALSTYSADLYWVSARAISGEAIAPVTEFPFWSFLYADLHPHLMALPFTLCLLALLVAWIRSTGFQTKVGVTLLIGLTLGFFWPTNTWDWPTYGAITGIVIFLTIWRRGSATVGGFVWALIKSLALFAVILAIGNLAFRPFHQSYVAGYGSFDRWTGPRTGLRDYLFIHGLFLFILGSAFVTALRRREFGFARGFRLWSFVIVRVLSGKSAERTRHLVRLGITNRTSVIGGLFGALLIVLTATAFMFGALPALLVAGIAVSVVMIWQRRQDPLRALPAVLALMAFSLSLVVECVVLAGDIGRMNTVFKFYYQVWVCFGLASALALPGLLNAWRGWKARGKWLWMLFLILMVSAAALFPLTATPAKIRDRFVDTPATLDGLRFAENATYLMAEGEFALKPDLHAIRWLQDNIQGSPVLLEINLGTRLYSWGSRFAVHTGLPSVIGWSWHQRQQQNGIDNNRVEQRIIDVLTIYRTDDIEKARQLISKYDVSLIVVGELERLNATPEGIAKFEQMGLVKIYDELNVQIYRVLPMTGDAGAMGRKAGLIEP